MKPDQGARAVDVVQVFVRQVGVNHGPGESWSRLQWLAGVFFPARGRLLLQKMPHGFRIELLLAGEVPIKPAMREPSGCPDLANRVTSAKPLRLNRLAADLTILFRVCCL